MNATYSSLEAIEDDIAEIRRLNLSPEYMAKQMHKIPDAPGIDRIEVIRQACRGKRVLNLGCASGALHERIASAAREVYCADCEPAPKEHHPHHQQLDLDNWMSVKAMWLPSVDVVVLGEIIEHLTNPGQLLCHLRQCNAFVVVSVPNAMSAGAERWAMKGYENVHIQHTAWYSYHTLHVLMERCGYRVLNFGWYNGEPRTAEGLVCIAEAKGD